MLSINTCLMSPLPVLIPPGRHPVLILSDRAVGASRAPLPSLLALGAVHQHLVARALRSKVALVCESGDAREIHHVCTARDDYSTLCWI